MKPESDRRELLARLLRERAAVRVAEHPLSYNQRSLWFTYCLAPESPAYNVPFAWRVQGGVDHAALRRAFEALVARHAILRTTYSNREPVQHVHAAQEIDFAVVDAAGWPEERLQEAVYDEIHRPFDLQRGPVMRVRLYEQGEWGDLLVVTFHHIAYDLWSITTFVDELLSLYASAKRGEPSPLPPPACQYTDFIRWQSEMLAADGEQLWQYWRERLSGALPVLALPTDRPRPPVQTYAGATFSQDVPTDTVAAVEELARREQTTLFPVLLAAYQVFLSRVSGQRDLTVGSPMFGRSRPEFEPVIGYFLNTLPLRGAVDPADSFSALVRETHRVVRGALEHQDYPLELMAERLRPARSANRPALFQTMFVLNRPRRVEPASHAGCDLSLELLPLERDCAQFDVSLEIDQIDGGLSARWEYNTDLFDEGTIERWAAEFQQLLREVAVRPEDPLANAAGSGQGRRGGPV